MKALVYLGPGKKAVEDRPKPGISAPTDAIVNQPVEVQALRLQLATYLGIGNRRPDLIVRFGRGPLMPRSLRRPVEEVLI